jgi:hypothetical protein
MSAGLHPRLLVALLAEDDQPHVVDRGQRRLRGRPGACARRLALGDRDGHRRLGGRRRRGGSASTSTTAEMLRWSLATTATGVRGDGGDDLRRLLDAGPDRDDDRVGEGAETSRREGAADQHAEREHDQQPDHAGPGGRNDILRLIFRLRVVE